MNQPNVQHPGAVGAEAPPSTMPTSQATHSPAETSPAATSPALGSPPNGADPLAGLYHMSITAGVGTQDYVAINVTAIVSVLLGIASVMVIISSVFMVAPLFGVVCGIIALRQIRTSNGTQTGSGLAAVGIVLSLGFALFVLGGNALAYLRTRDDSAAIAALCERFGNDCRDRNFDDAYSLFTPHFQSHMPRQRFLEGMDHMEREMVGPIVSATWNGRAEFTTNPDLGTTDAAAMIKFQYKNVPPGNEDREPVQLRKEDGVWKFESMLSLFPAASYTDAPPPQ